MINPKSSIPRLHKVLDGLTSERHKVVLGIVLEHAVLESETVWDVDQIMTTLVPEPVYHIWVNGTDVGPKGAEAVRSFYGEAVRSRATFMEFDAERVVVDDNCAVLEGFVKHVCPGALAASLGMGIEDSDAEFDPEAVYLVVYRNLTVIPVNEDGLMEGEDVYISGPTSFRKLSREEETAAMAAAR